MIEKQALALERRQDTKSLRYDIVQEALRAVDDLLLDDSLSHQKESTRSALMRHAGVHILVNFDETFIHFYPSDDYVCGATRVGSKIHEDSKIGCTVMVGMDYFSSKMLPPFIVLKPF